MHSQQSCHYYASLLSVLRTQFRSVTIIAEGIPENKTKKLIKKADSLGVTIIGPATVNPLLLYIIELYVCMCQ